MPHSLVKNYLHIIYSTKSRQELITETIENKLYAYMSGICKKLESPAVIIGGHKDHVHILCNLSRKVALTKFIEEVKSHSSLWIKKEFSEFQNFYWQRGYGAFSVNPKDVEHVVSYIENQHVHHQKMSFQDEYRMFLKRYNIEFDERYVWD